MFDKLIAPYATDNFYVQNASTWSLFSVAKKILDENIERKNGDIPNVWDFILHSELSWHGTKNLWPKLFELYIEVHFIMFCILIITLHVQRVASLLKVVVQEIDQRFFRQSEDLRKVYFMIFNFTNLLVVIFKFSYVWLY